MRMILLGEYPSTYSRSDLIRVKSCVTNTMHGRFFKFLGLPAELRNKIFEFVIVNVDLKDKNDLVSRGRDSRLSIW